MTAVATVVSLISTHAASAYTIGPPVTFGGYYSNGGMYTAAPVLAAYPPSFGENKDRVGALVTNGSKLEVGSTTLIDVRDNAIGETIGLIVQHQSQVNVAAGAKVQANEVAIGDSIGVVTEFDGVATIAGAFTLTEEGNGSAIGIIGEDSSVINHSGTMSLSELGNGDAIPFHLTDSARLVSTGEFLVSEDGNASRAGALAAGDSSAYLNGGKISIRSDGLSFGVPIIMLELIDTAFVQIAGGTYEVIEDNVAITPYIAVNDRAELRIKGSGFNRPYGKVNDGVGDISGTLLNGQPIHFTFTRDPGAMIVLVPEPAGIFLASLSCIGVLALKRGRSY